MADVDVDVDVEVHDAPDFEVVPDGQDVKDTSTAPPPAPNPDAQTTVNDFLDYTDFYPSDLVRSLTLIGELDARCADAVQHMHDLTALYCQLPQLPEPDRPDAARLRAQIARHLHTAIAQRAYASNEADRLYELTTRHCQRASIIRRKLQAQPEPPSRDPTPPPVSPTALRRTYERPRLHLALDHYHTNNTNNHHRKSAVPVPRGRPRARSTSSSPVSDSLDPVDHHHHHNHRPRKRHSYKDRPPKPRSRAPGVAGTNVHSSIAGISTSNALAKLTPPPADARPGSKWAPWMKLTEYEMAVLRKQMKKNAVWTPSLTMVNRELERKHRTRAHYDREKARCEAAGESLLDEEPETLLQIATAQGVDDPALTATANAADGLTAPGDPTTTTINNTTTTTTAPPRDDESVDGHTDRDTRRQKARGALRALEDATKTIQNAADGLKELTFSAVATPPARRKSTARPTTAKRKRDTSTAESTRDPEAADKDTSSTLPPEPKRPRLQLIAPAPPPEQTPSTPAPRSAATPAPSAATPAPRSTTTPARKDPPSPVSHTPVPLPETSPTTIQIPLAPAGPSTPKAEHSASAQSSRPPTPAEHSPTSPKRSSPVVPVPAPDEPPAQLSITAASTRAGRKSITPKNSSPPPAEPSKPRPASTEPAIALRPRSSRSHVPTPKAQSEEPKPNEGRPVRDARRHSIFSQSALTAPAPTRASARRKPPPKGEITSAEHGQKTVTNVKRSQGSKNNKKKPNGVVGGEGKPGHFEEEVDSDEERYCICDDVSYGQMISCDNNCDKEWFHFECVGMTQMPARRAKWYCPDCRKKLGTDAFGNPLVPPALPGRGRGNRGWST